MDQMKNEVDTLMNKLYDCGKLYRGDISIGILKDYWRKTLTEDDGVLLTRILYGKVKAACYNKRTRLVDIDFVHAFAEKETSFRIKDIKVVVNWTDSDDREDSDNVMDYVRFFISRKC